MCLYTFKNTLSHSHIKRKLLIAIIYYRENTQDFSVRGLSKMPLGDSKLEYLFIKVDRMRARFLERSEKRLSSLMCPSRQYCCSVTDACCFERKH